MENRRVFWRAILAAVCVFGATSLGSATAEELRVKAMTFNIRLSRAHDGENDWQHREAMVRDLIRQYGADFVGVQEAWPDQIAFLRDALPEYGHIVRSREADPKDGEAIPLFFRQERWKIDPSEHGTLWLSDTPTVPGSKGWGNGVPRIITWGRFTEKATGRGIYVFNVHLDHLSEPSRVRSAQFLAKRISSRSRMDPVLVLGDFNSGEKGGAVKQLTSKGPDNPVPLVDTFRILRPKDGNVGTFHGFSGSVAGMKIDYIFTLPKMKVLDARILHDNRDGHYPSDHFPVVAEIAFP